MSKKKHKDECCTCYYCQPCCCCEPCCCEQCCCCANQQNMNRNNFGGCNGCWEAILFWLIACGAGILNTSSILIILLFLLYGWSQGGCQMF
ncbi:MAG: hypothetical protein ACLRRH_00770 [Clostridium sp.]